jgi:hypothetical protein
MVKYNTAISSNQLIKQYFSDVTIEIEIEMSGKWYLGMSV